MDGATLMFGDCLERMTEIPDGSVDAIVTDPPYGLTELAWDRAIDWPRWWAETRRVAKPNAAFVLFAQQPFATDLINSNRNTFKYDLVWAKNTSTGFLDAGRRPLRSHELILIFGKRITYNRVDWPRETFSRKVGATTTRKKERGGAHWGSHSMEHVYTYKAEACPTSILRFKRPGNFKAANRANHHPTAKPLDMMEWLVKSYSNEGDTVLDPFAGSGTTGVACLNTGRRFIGIEQDGAYFAIADRRIAEAEGRSLALTTRGAAS